MITRSITIIRKWLGVNWLVCKFSLVLACMLCCFPSSAVSAPFVLHTEESNQLRVSGLERYTSLAGAHLPRQPDRGLTETMAGPDVNLPPPNLKQQLESYLDEIAGNWHQLEVSHTSTAAFLSSFRELEAQVNFFGSNKNQSLWEQSDTEGGQWNLTRPSTLGAGKFTEPAKIAKADVFLPRAPSALNLSRGRLANLISTEALGESGLELNELTKLIRQDFLSGAPAQPISGPNFLESFSNVPGVAEVSFISIPALNLERDKALGNALLFGKYVSFVNRLEQEEFLFPHSGFVGVRQDLVNIDIKDFLRLGGHYESIEVFQAASYFEKRSPPKPLKFTSGHNQQLPAANTKKPKSQVRQITHERPFQKKLRLERARRLWLQSCATGLATCRDALVLRK